MNTRMVYKARYLYPGSFFPEETSRTLDLPTFEDAVAKGPDEDGYFKKDGWYAVEIMSTKEERFVSEDGQREFWQPFGIPVKERFIVGRLTHVDDIADLVLVDGYERDNTILKSNIRSNSRDPLRGYGVLTRCGNWQIASDWDKVVPL